MPTPRAMCMPMPMPMPTPRPMRIPMPMPMPSRKIVLPHATIHRRGLFSTDTLKILI